MAVEEGFIQYTVDVSGADRVRREFDELADAAIKTGKGFDQLDKHLSANEKRYGRLVARLRESAKALQEYSNNARKAEGSNAAKSIDERKRAYEEERKQVALLSEELERMQKRRKLDTELEGNIGQANKATDKNENQQIATELGREEAARARLTKAIAEQTAAEQRLNAVGDPRKGNLDAARYGEANAALKDYTQKTNEVTAAQRNMDSAMEETNQGIISQRYALYDVSNTLMLIGGAMSGIGIYAAVTGAQFESAFTNVERTLESGLGMEEIQGIRDELIMLQGQIPLTFAEITTIAQLGNQLGIAADEVTNFTRVVAQFSSLTGISTEEAALAFGQLGNLLGVTSEHYENLASSIVLVGVNSAATEQQIISIAREIAPAARAAGLAADEVVGLSGALGSIRVPPERSRSTILQFFEKLNTAAAEGGDQMANFAAVVGTSVEDLTSRVRGGQGMGILEDFLGTLSEEDTIGVTRALDALGLAGLRTNPTMRALSDNMSLLDSTMTDAHNGFIQGSELQDRYAMTLDDLNSQWVIFINGLNSLVDAISSGAIPGLSGMLQLVNQLVFGMVEFLQRNPWAKYILGIGVGLTTVTGIMIVFRAMVMRGQASLLAFATAAGITTRVNIGAMGSLRGLIGGFFGVQRAASAATSATLTFSRVLSRTLWGAAIVGAGWLVGELFNLGGAAEDASISMDEYNQIANASRDASGGAAGGADNLADSLGGGGGGGGGVAEAAEEAGEKLRLLTDYAQDLAGVLNRSFSLRFDSAAAMDSVISKWNKLREEAEKYQQEINKLTADKSLRQYWLGVAEMYDDQLRAGQLRAEIADIDADLAKAQAGASTELRGNSQAAIENRNTMRDLLGGYQDYIEALAASGASQAFIQSEIRRLNGDFRDQATALGFNRSELKDYTVAFQDMSTIVTGVPKDVTIGFNGNPALQALAEFNATLEEQAKQAGQAAGSGAGDSFGGGLGDSLGGLDYDDMLDPFADAVDEVTEEGASTWDKFWWNVGHVAIRGIAAIVEPLWGAQEAIKALFAGEDVGAAWERGIAEAGVNVRDQFGAIGFMGAAALEAEFKRGNKPGEWIADGITYAWDPVAREMSRVGAVGVEEWRAKMEEAGKLVGPVIVDGVNWAEDPITGEVYRVGEESAASWNSALLERLDPTIVARKAAEGEPLANQQAKTLAESMGLEYNSVLNDNADPIGKILNKIQQGKDLTGDESRTLARADANAYNSRLGSTLNIGGKISDEFGSVSSTSARNAGSRSGTGFWNGVSSALSGFGNWIADLFDPGPSIGSRARPKSGGGYSGGGYTGPGHWLQPAGVVHAKEYVVPSWGVDQRTKLPKMDYVQSLHNSKPAPRGGGGAGYAGGGFVGGAGAIELGEYTISRLGRQVNVGLRVDRQELATATSGGDARLAQRGSN